MGLLYGCSALLLLVILAPRAYEAGNILVFPTEGSHWVNMDILLQALHSQGHNITIVRSSKSWYVEDNSSCYHIYTVQVERSLDQKFLSNLVFQAIEFERGALPWRRFLHMAVGMIDIWLMRADFVFEYPRPTMPNVVYIGGFQCKPPKPLPQPFDDFVQSSGEHGVIIMSLGTFVSELPAEITKKIAAVFAELPQKVIWKHKGAKPDNLGNNTLVVDWMPQNDLLGHPKVKLFVAHGGTNGVQEAIYHGVPVVGLPLFFDQYDNLLRLKERGGAKLLTIQTVDKDNNFLEAIQEVLNEPSYTLSMQRLSRLHRDQPMEPLDNAVFWIEHVMRHKGANHLKAESYRLPWYVYHSVDVIVFVAGAVLLFLLTVFFSIRCLYTVMCKRKVKRD
ncbi:UDP-glucuronosyltransferase 2B13-like isoform X3 [Betta splendens]|uniref:UDP-glucuronosyltransferase n=2 Tax=Betta splendens TaxID=158456 RepID=A0A6P7M1E0_BETSP|nr:UDP-glucuronosyltransferase 2B13-like isoform X3 [Betta splendens]